MNNLSPKNKARWRASFGKASLWTDCEYTDERISEEKKKTIYGQYTASERDTQIEGKKKWVIWKYIKTFNTHMVNTFICTKRYMYIHTEPTCFIFCFPHIFEIDFNVCLRRSETYVQGYGRVKFWWWNLHFFISIFDDFSII